ncbi:MAG: hypothetical protein PF636_07620 [Actinomycetota bacterium]|jgi:hypothetical protein|nr:hypothetical protein [Actinomycetota bacterium]
MSLAFAAVLIIVGIVGAVALSIGIPAVIGMMLYDVFKTPRVISEDAGDASFRIAVERGVARAFVILGGAFWSVAGFAALYSFRETGATEALLAASIPLVACAVTIIIGWYYERFTAALLLMGSFAVIAWGVIYQFEAGVWAIMTLALIGPALTASVLFWLARRDQEAYERVTALRPDLAFVFAARSSLSN